MGTGSGGGGRGFRGFTRSAPSRERALRKLPDGNFRRPLVGSLRALTSAEMVALTCIAAARTGFLLAALHSVAKRVSRGQAYHPTRSRPRWPEDRPARLRRYDPQLRSHLEPSRHVPWSGIDRKTRGVLVLAAPPKLATLLPAAVNGDLLRWRA